MPEVLGIEIPFGRGSDDDPGSPNKGKDRVERIVEAASAGFRANVNVEALRPRIQQAIDQGLDDETIVGLVQGYIGNTPEERTERVTELFERPDASALTGPGSASQSSSVPGNFDPSVVAESIVSSAAMTAPDPSQFDNPEDYKFAYRDWQDILEKSISISQSLREMGAGIVRLDDGSIITQAQFDNLDPFAQQQVVAAYSNRNAQVMNDYNDLLNTLDLSEYQTAMNAAETASSVASRNFQNKLAEYQQQVSNQQANQQTALHKIDRQLGGMQESRARAADVTAAQMEAAPFTTTGGKSSFSAGDLGGGVARLAQFGGQRPDIPFLNFTGTTSINPGALMAAGDASLGVGGPLPEVPDLNLGPVPTAPQAAVPNIPIPQMRRPQMPTLIPLPFTPSPNPDMAARGR